ncbi:unnamed protein product [Prorocentrum cordatum]|uniref:Carrier domain-containing protein n=1 Tax=Prorocentrum cordatum TaxID=2364126 RepID=A0ABN9T350_9DINO|nr:unnamed protein product [Polarella glacialis]
MPSQLGYCSGGPLPPPGAGTPRTLAEALLRTASQRPDGGLTVYERASSAGSGGGALFLSYAALLSAARRVAAGLLHEAVPRGAPVVLLLRTRAAQLVALWGCVLAGVRPCLLATAAGAADQALPAFLGRQAERLAVVVLTLHGERALPMPQVRQLRVDTWLNDELDLQQALPRSVLERGETVATVVAGDGPECEYHFTGAAIMANMRSECAAFSCDGADASEPPVRLSWLPLAEPVALLAHCAAVALGMDEVHAETGGDPRATLRLARRHRVSLLAAPAVFFRRASEELRRASSDAARRGAAAGACDLECVRVWVVHGALGDDDAADFLRLARPSTGMPPGLAAPAVRRALVAPWGCLLAVGDPLAGAELRWTPAPGLELRALAREAATSCAPSSGGSPPRLQVRGSAAAPGVAWGARAGRWAVALGGWVDARCAGTVVSGRLSSASLDQCLAGAGESVQVSGSVEFAPAEIESAIEAAPGVLRGSAVAVAARLPAGGGLDGRETHRQRGLAIAFSAVEQAPSSKPVVTEAVLNQLALSLGIRPQLAVLFPRADVPRDCAGQPDRARVRAAIEAGAFGEAALDSRRSAAEALPGDWVWEEEFRPGEVPLPPGAGAGGGEDDDLGGDDIEERMEGAASEDGSDAAGAVEREAARTLVVCDPASQVGDQIVSRLQEDGGCVAKVRASRGSGEAEDWAALLAGGVTSVVHSTQYSSESEASEGSEAAVELLALLQAWRRERHGAPSEPLRLLCLSSGRHVRVAGARVDPRKSILLGVLLCAATEWQQLRAVQLDVAPELPEAKAAHAAVAELRGAAGGPASEVLVDAEGQRLERRLRQAPLLPAPAQHGRPRAALLVGGAGGVGLLWAKSINADRTSSLSHRAETLVLLGRSPLSTRRAERALAALSGSGADVLYLQADLGDPRQLKSAFQGCIAAGRIDYAASFAEAFQAPASLFGLPLGALQAPAHKLRGARNLLELLARSRAPATRQVAATPVLLASTVVGLLGAPQLAPYAAGARALEALCAKERLGSGPLDPRFGIVCVALSAWADVGITTAFPALADSAPAAGFHVLSHCSGLLALEAAFAKFSPPRFGTLFVGVNGQHPRWVQLIASGETSATMATTETLPGCIELVLGTIKTVLGKDVKLGSSFGEVGVDSMSSMSLRSALVSATGGLELPSTVFYDLPSVLELAKFIHGEAAPGAGGKAGGGSAPVDAGAQGPAAAYHPDAALEALLEDAEARRSYHLGLAREALRCGDAAAAHERCLCAMDGASGPALVSALALDAVALERTGAASAAGEALARSLEAQQAAAGPLHVDTAAAVVQLCLWCDRHGQSDSRARELRRRLGEARRAFFRGICWPATAWWTPAEPEASFAQVLSSTSLRRLSFDGQGLADQDLGALGVASSLEVLRLRRNGLRQLPAVLGRLVQLRELWLTSNLLHDLPAELTACSRLQVLALEANCFARLPTVVSSFRRLLQLGFDEQRCEVGGVGQCRLQAQVLSVLRARGCAAEFPDLYLPGGGGPNLNTVFWANNALAAVPAVLGHFASSLRLLDLAHNRIAALGEELFGSLSSLRDLSLAGNRLTSLPAAVGTMRALQQLWLHGNALEELPEELGSLGSLAILELHHNRLISLPIAAVSRLHKLNWLFAHGNQLTDGAGLLAALGRLPRLKICGLGANRLELGGLDLGSFRSSFGLGWNPGLVPGGGVLTEALTTCDLSWDRLDECALQDVLVVTFSAQGAPIAQGQAEVRALRDALLPVDALYVCDPANAWYLQDPGFDPARSFLFRQQHPADHAAVPVCVYVGRLDGRVGGAAVFPPGELRARFQPSG